MPKTNEPITKAILKLRERLSMTQQGLAVALGTSVRTVAHWEAGRLPSWKSLAQLAGLAADNKLSDIGALFANQMSKTYTWGAKTLFVKPQNGQEQVLCMIVLEAFRDPQFADVKERLLDMLMPVFSHVISRVSNDWDIDLRKVFSDEPCAGIESKRPREAAKKRKPK